MSLHLHAIVTNLVDELRLEKFSCFLLHLCVFMWCWASSLRRSLPKSAVAHAHGRSVRRFTLARASSAFCRLRWCGPCRTTCNAAPSLVPSSQCFLTHLDFVVLLHAVLVLFLWCLLGVLRNWDVNGRVNVLKQWDIRRSRCLLNHKPPVVASLQECP